MMQTHTRFQFDTVQPIALSDVRIVNLTGYPLKHEPFDPTGWLIYFRMWERGSTDELKISDAAASAPDEGALRYDPATADVDESGEFVGQFFARFEADPTEILWFPQFPITIEAVIGGAPV